MIKYLPIVFLIVFASCEKNDPAKEEDGQITITDIQGKWRISQTKERGEYTSEIAPCLKDSYFQFAGSDGYAHSYRCISNEATGFFSLERNVVTIQYPHKKIVYTVIDINGNTGEFIRIDSDGTRQEFIAIKE